MIASQSLCSYFEVVLIKSVLVSRNYCTFKLQKTWDAIQPADRLSVLFQVDDFNAEIARINQDIEDDKKRLDRLSPHIRKQVEELMVSWLFISLKGAAALISNIIKKGRSNGLRYFGC